MTTITAHVPPALAAKLAAEAKARRVRPSTVVREVLERRYGKKGKAKRHRPTVGELAGHLFGSIKGTPPDLASNPKYMEGFGE